MKKPLLLGILCLFVLCLTFSPFIFNLHIFNHHHFEPESESEGLGQDGMKELQAYEAEITKDPSLGYVPLNRLIEAQTMELAQGAQRENGINGLQGFTWTERGSYSDAAGPYGNPRPTGASTSGRILCMWVDLADATNKTVWAGGADGGIWKTTDITAATPTWTPVDDYLANMAIGSICQDPTNTNIMYMGTGEKTWNADAIKGGGVWKSTDHGASWSLLASTTGFWNVSKILCDNSGNVYVGTIGSNSGLQRSTDGGSTWTNITPSINAGGGGAINTSRVSDMAYDAVNNKLHVVMGYIPGSTSVYEGYCYTTRPATITSSTWTAPVTSFITSGGSMDNCAIACSGSTVYATPANTSDMVTTVYKSTDGGANWAATTAAPSNSGYTAYSNGQGWYCLGLAVDPANGSNVILGSLNCYKSTDGGATWSNVSVWVTYTSSEYVHADQHCMTWNGNNVLVGCDGGVFYSSDGGSTFASRNTNLRIKQFYSVAVHPTSTNYFLAGAQDNGVHALNGAGLTTSTEVSGGDGMLVAIDQDEPSYQVGTYVYNHYHVSSNGGVTWKDYDFYKGSSSSYSEFGSFVNAFDYDNTGNAIYAGAGTNEFFRWTNPQTLTSNTYYSSTFPTGVDLISVPNMGSGKVSAVKVSPYTANLVYFGTSNGKLIAMSNAKTVASGTSGSLISGSFPGGNISCVNVGSNDNYLIVSLSNYGINNIWISSDAGSTWTTVDGNLPDMPVRWVMYYPGDNTKAIIATEAGIYQTSLLNGSSTVWAKENAFPSIRTDMLAYRSSDQLLVAATHGRGIWSATVTSVLPVTLVDFTGSLETNSITLNWETSMEQHSKSFEIEKSTDGTHFYSIGTTKAAGFSFSPTSYSFRDPQVASVNYYRLNMIDMDGKSRHSPTIIIRNNSVNQNIWVTTNPFQDRIGLRLARPVERLKLELLNEAGNLIMNKELNKPGQQVEWQLSMLIARGTYYLRITDEYATTTKKLVKP